MHCSAADPSQRKGSDAHAATPYDMVSPPRRSFRSSRTEKITKLSEAAVTADYNAESAVQRELVLRLASILWRLRRASGIETALFDALADDCADHPSPQPHLSLDYAREVVDLRPREAGLHPQKRIADTFLRLAEQPTYAFDRLSRYEYLLWRQARQIIVTLDVSQRCKRELRVRPSLSFLRP